MAVVDILAIAGLGFYVWTRRRPAQPQPIIEVAPPSSECADFLLTSAGRAGWTARVSESDTGLLYEVSLGASQGAVADPQTIWAVLDSMSPEFAQLCGTYQRVTIAAIVDIGQKRQVTAQFAGETLANWVQSLASDSDLASQALYRISSMESP